MKNLFKNIIEKIKKVSFKEEKPTPYLYVFTFLGLVFLFTFSLTIINLIPSEPVRDHIVASYETFKEEDDRHWLTNKKQSLMDIGSDMHMANITYYIDPSHPFRSTLKGARYEDPKWGHALKLYELTISGEPSNEDYARYWHGWSLWARPIYLFLTYAQGRIILNLVFYALLLIVLFLIAKRLKWIFLIPFMVCIWASYYRAIPMNWHYFNVYLVTLSSIVFLLLKFDKIKISKIPWIFFIIGALTCFFDLLTAPLVAFGLPFIIVFSLVWQENLLKSFKEHIIFLIKTGIAWFSGYVSLWLSKWVLTDAILNSSIVKNGFDNIKNRTGGGSIHDRLNIVYNQYQHTFNNPKLFFWLLGIAALIILIYAIKSKKWIPMAVLILTALSPIPWYYFTADHARIHIFFTFRSVSVTIYAILTALIMIYIDIKKDRMEKIDLANKKEKK